MLEEEGNFRLAEHHYVEALDFKAAINMFCLNNMFEDAYRVFLLFSILGGKKPWRAKCLEAGGISMG